MSIKIEITKLEADMIGRGLRLLLDEEGWDNRTLVLLAYMFNGVTADEANAMQLGVRAAHSPAPDPPTRREAM